MLSILQDIARYSLAHYEICNLNHGPNKLCNANCQPKTHFSITKTLQNSKSIVLIYATTEVHHLYNYNVVMSLGFQPK